MAPGSSRARVTADRLFSILPDDQKEYFRGLWEEFERVETPEARFALALDKIQPTMLNNASGGKSWTEHGVKVSQILDRNAKTPEGSQVLWDYAKEHYIEPNVSEQGKERTIINDR